MKQLMENFRKFINEAPKELSKTTGLYLEDSLIVVYDYYGMKVSVKRSLGNEKYMEKVDNAIQEGEKSAAHSALEAMQSEIMRGVSRGIIKKNTAARKISRLSAQVRNLS